MKNWNLNIDCRCKLAITDLRNRLDAETVEAIECLRWWIKGGLVKGVLEMLIAEEEEYLTNMKMDVEEEWMEDLHDDL